MAAGAAARAKWCAVAQSAFRDRQDAAERLAQELRGIPLRDPLVLAIPRGGAVTGSVLARRLGAELDVVLARKLGAPGRPELAVGAVSEDGAVYLDQAVCAAVGTDRDYLERQRRRQLREIERRGKLIRAVRPPASARERSVILTDDGIATGATMIAALHAVKSQGPHEIIVAVPVAAPGPLHALRGCCDRVVCLLEPQFLWAISEFYASFDPVEDEQVVKLLRDHAAQRASAAPAPGAGG